ncbi:enoyl-[acyl-carrier protein] reductase II [Weissella beninensis]|uniref:Probable nitronate monooxygenase n=1 Tax=Periweissella beninensis TaxID=504936 RepID=A0ABT0VFD5_9LACO|nr:nitronate monooxygenase [Periweissella beninensis]MBM7543518.1 enoyl-[acyl-carrier protein] reductase II [Periweissella beninensis]MCM2436500.1 nitronate monooxygenase [Periweissella beninensis]
MELHPFYQELGLMYPIFQGGMAWAADGKLAAAVSKAGGLGIIGSGHFTGEQTREQIKIAKKITNKPFGVNVMLLNRHVEDVLDVIIEEGVAVVTTGAGNPAQYVERLHKAHIKVIPVVPSVGLAKMMERIGVDAVIAEGLESGGHIGKLTTLALVPQVVDALKIPVIAAGGIADGRGVAAALMLGAIGVQMGTRFLTVKESGIHQNYKNAVLKAKDVDTLVTGAYLGHAARVLKNRMAKNFIKLEKAESVKAQPDMETLEKIGNGALRRAVLEGDPEHGSFMAGEIAGLVNDELTASEVLEQIWTQTTSLIVQ